MSQQKANYSQSQGLKLLEAGVQAYGPIFTIDQIAPLAIEREISRSQLRWLLSSLARSGWLEALKRGTYVVTSPLFAGEIHPFVIAAALVQPIAISHWSALAYYGYTNQLPVMLQASTPRKVVTPEMRQGEAYRPRGRAVWRVLEIEVEFIRVMPKHFFGHQQVWANVWQQVAITDPERTALDLVARPDVFGGLPAAIEIFEDTLHQIDVALLVKYALQYDVGAVIKRLGWLLEQLGLSAEQTNPLQRYPVSSYYRLDPARPPGSYISTRWRLNENLEGSYAGS